MTTTPTTPISTPATRRAAIYHHGPRQADRSTPCPNRNGIWPPLYRRQWNQLPPISRSNHAQREYQRCVHDALAAGELHRTTALVLLAYSRASSDTLEDVWIAQATVAAHLGLSESTVCHHIAKAKTAGWLRVQHRNRIDRGEVRAMSNITRLELPEHWHLELERRRGERRRRQAAERSAHRGGRTTPKRSDRPGDERTGQPTPASHAASAGAAEARTAPDYRTGEANLQERYHGQPALYEAAWAEYNATWSAVRRE